jgi:DNA-binding MarR family transcriptional regulator
VRDDESYPLWTLVQAAHVVARGFTRVFAEVGLTPTQFGVLAHLVEDDGLSQAELARRVLVRPQSVGELVGSLIDRGLVRRDGPGGRGRRSGLAITEAGRVLYETALPSVAAFHRSESTGLTRDQLAVLDDLLQRLLRRMESGRPL